jgi:threonine/homoserine/homoserine lactone efflux protein
LDGRFLAYVAVMAILIVTPGPDMLMVTRTVLRSGRRAASLVTLGIGGGIAVWACASVIGIAVLLERSVLAFTVLKLAGAAYLLYLGVRSLLGRGSAPVAADPGDRTPIRARTALVQGFLSNLLNPKAGAVFATVVPQFIRPGDSSGRLALMVIAFELMLLVWLHLYAAAIARAGRSRAGAALRRGFERVAGAVLIALGLRLALERR